jgi:GntR family transcriptional regulator
VVIDVWFYVNPSSHVPVYVQIMEKIKGLIAKEKLRKGDMVPSIRNLAKDLGVNLNTVARAYRELVREGVLKPIKGEGYVVLGLSESFRRSKLKSFREFVVELKNIGISRNEIMRIIEEVYKDDPEG